MCTLIHVPGKEKQAERQAAREPCDQMHTVAQKGCQVASKLDTAKTREILRLPAKSLGNLGNLRKFAEFFPKRAGLLLTVSTLVVPPGCRT